MSQPPIDNTQTGVELSVYEIACVWDDEEANVGGGVDARWCAVVYRTEEQTARKGRGG